MLPSAMKKTKRKIPMTVPTEFLSPKDIAADVFSKLTPEDKRVILEHASTAEDMIAFHHGVGTNIRNHYGLWKPDNPYTKIDAVPNSAGIIDDAKFPDQVSHEILMDVWHRVKAEKHEPS